MDGRAVRGMILMENEGGSGVENEVLGQEPEWFVVVSLGKIEVGGAVRGLNLIEKEGSLGVEGPESFLVVSMGGVRVGVGVVEENGIESGAVWSVVLIESRLCGSGVENDVLQQGPESFVVVSVGKMDVGGALRGANLIEKEGGSGVENDLGQGPESFVVVSVGKIEVGAMKKGMELGVVFVSIDTSAIGSEADNRVVQKVSE